MGFVSGNSDRIMIKITVIGTLSNIPVTPHITPQTASVKVGPGFYWWKFNVDIDVQANTTKLLGLS